MAGLTVDVVGLEKAVMALVQLGPTVMQAAAEAALEEADYELGLTLVEVPFETGALFNTGRVEEVDDEAGQLTAAIAYGDETVDYALAVHEDLEVHHDPPTKAKFVEDPVRAEMESGRALARMRAIMEPALEGGAPGGPHHFSTRAAQLVTGGR